MSRVVRLYPGAWRARYGDELDDLAQARPLGLAGAIDLIRGAIDAHRHPELVDPSITPPTGLDPVSRRRLQELRIAQRLGIGTWFGSVLWIFAWVVAAQGPMVGTGAGAYRDGSAAMPLYFGALALLAAGLVGQLIRLPSRLRIARFGAFIGIVAAMMWAFGPWLVLFAGFLFAGLLVLAVGAWWGGEWSGPAASAVVAATLIGTAIVVASLTAGREPLGQGLLVAFVSLLTVVWLAVGASLQKLPSVDEGARVDDDAIAETAAA